MKKRFLLVAAATLVATVGIISFSAFKSNTTLDEGTAISNNGTSFIDPEGAEIPDCHTNGVFCTATVVHISGTPDLHSFVNVANDGRSDYIQNVPAGDPGGTVRVIYPDGSEYDVTYSEKAN